MVDNLAKVYRNAVTATVHGKRVYTCTYKFSLRSGMSVACKTLVEIRIRSLMVRFELFYQKLKPCAAIAAIAQIDLLITKYAFE